MLRLFPAPFEMAEKMGWYDKGRLRIAVYWRPTPLLLLFLLIATLCALRECHPLLSAVPLGTLRALPHLLYIPVDPLLCWWLAGVLRSVRMLLHLPVLPLGWGRWEVVSLALGLDNCGWGVAIMLR